MSRTAVVRSNLFVDEDFPATKASIGGVQGDQANPNVAKYLEALHRAQGLLDPIISY